MRINLPSNIVSCYCAVLSVATALPTYSIGEVVSGSPSSSISLSHDGPQILEGDTQDGAGSDNYFEEYVIVCSNIAALTADNLQKFLLQVGRVNDTEITSKFVTTPPSHSKYSVFVASSGEVDDSLKECLNDLPRAAAVEIGENVERQSRAITSESRMVGAEYLPDIYGPPKATWEYYMTDSGVNVRSLASIESEPYRSTHAATYFFGIDPNVCEKSRMCSIFSGSDE